MLEMSDSKPMGNACEDNLYCVGRKEGCGDVSERLSDGCPLNEIVLEDKKPW